MNPTIWYISSSKDPQAGLMKHFTITLFRNLDLYECDRVVFVRQENPKHFLGTSCCMGCSQARARHQFVLSKSTAEHEYLLLAYKVLIVAVVTNDVETICFAKGKDNKIRV